MERVRLLWFFFGSMALPGPDLCVFLVVQNSSIAITVAREDALIDAGPICDCAPPPPPPPLNGKFP